VFTAQYELKLKMFCSLIFVFKWLINTNSNYLRQQRRLRFAAVTFSTRRVRKVKIQRS